MNIRIKFKKALSIILTVSTVICMLSVFSANATVYTSEQTVDVSALQVGDVIRKGATITNGSSNDKPNIKYGSEYAVKLIDDVYKSKDHYYIKEVNNGAITVVKYNKINYYGIEGSNISDIAYEASLPAYCIENESVDFTSLSPIFDGYKFEGFYVNTEYDTELENVTYSTDGNIIKNGHNVYLKLTPKTYTVTFANTTLSSVSYTYGEGRTLNDIVPTLPTGCTFAYWSYSEDLSLGKTDTITETDYGDKTFYPAYNCRITYYDEDGETVLSVEGAPTSYTEGKGIADLTAYSPTNIPEGKTFAGWYSSASGGTPMKNISSKARGCINLYARYKGTDKFITSSVGGYMLDSNGKNVYIVAFGAEYTGTEEVTTFGFYVYGSGENVDSEKKLTLTASKGNKLNATNNKFYIYADSVSLGTTYYAKAYIKIGETIYTSPIISCTPNEDNLISN